MHLVIINVKLMNRKNISLFTISFALLFVVNFAFADFDEMHERYNRYEDSGRSDMMRKGQDEIQERLLEMTREQQRAVREVKSRIPHDVDEEDVLKMKRRMQDDLKRPGIPKTEMEMHERIKESAREFERDINERVKKTMSTKEYEKKYERAEKLRKEAEERMKKEIHKARTNEFASRVERQIPERAIPFVPVMLPYVPTNSKEEIEGQRKIVEEFIEKVKNAKTEEERRKAIEEFKEKNRKLAEKRKQDAIKYIKENKKEAGKLARYYLASAIFKAQSVVERFKFTIKRLREIVAFLDKKGKDTTDIKPHLNLAEKSVKSAEEILKNLINKTKELQNSEDINEIKNMAARARGQVKQIKDELKSAKEHIKEAAQLIRQLLNN